MNRKSISITLVALLMLPMLAACATQTGVNEIDDATLEASVRAKIAEVNTGEATELNVDVDKGVVTLGGQVASSELRSKIASEVRELPGVRSVINNMTIR